MNIVTYLLAYVAKCRCQCLWWCCCCRRCRRRRHSTPCCSCCVTLICLFTRKKMYANRLTLQHENKEATTAATTSPLSTSKTHQNEHSLTHRLTTAMKHYSVTTYLYACLFLCTGNTNDNNSSSNNHNNHNNRDNRTYMLNIAMRVQQQQCDILGRGLPALVSEYWWFKENNKWDIHIRIRGHGKKRIFCRRKVNELKIPIYWNFHNWL